MKYLSKLALSVAVALSVPAVAGVTDDRTNLTTACEEALALSALPARLRADASVYSLTNDGFKLTREGDGPFTCIVERNHKSSLIPQCADAAGADTIIPGIMQKTEWALAGVSVAERKQRFSQLAEEGKMRPPGRPGINYMMSAFNYVWNTQQEEIMHIPPHIMFYAPNINNDDVGGSRQEAMGGNRGVPFVIEEGIHGYMTSFVERPSDSSEVNAACGEQVSAAKSIPAEDVS